MIAEIVAGVVVAGAFGWAAYETRRGRTETTAKIDAMDLLIRGDGNGNLGFGERLRDVQETLTGNPTKRISGLVGEVAALRGELRDHIDDEESRIIEAFEKFRDENEEA